MSVFGNKWIKRTSMAFFVLIAIVAMWHNYATYRTNAEFKMPGRLIDVGDHRLHFKCDGNGTHTIVVDAGLSGASYDWTHIQNDLSSVARVCTYDRAGYGWSERATGPRTSFHIVADLHFLLHNTPELKPPFVLVGHSFGGLNMRLYASTYPDDVSALVLIDALNTDVYPDDFPSGEVGFLYSALNFSAAIGFQRFLIPYKVRSPKRDPVLLDMRRQMLGRTKSTCTVYDELAGQRNWREIRDSMNHLGSTPVLVISRGVYPSPIKPRGEYWKKGQLELETTVSANARRVVAENCGHEIQFEKPELIVVEIKKLLAQLDAGHGM